MLFSFLPPFVVILPIFLVMYQYWNGQATQPASWLVQWAGIAAQTIMLCQPPCASATILFVPSFVLSDVYLPLLSLLSSVCGSYLAEN